MMLVFVFFYLLGAGRGEGGKDGTSLLANVGCDGRSSKKDLQDMSVALLHAHRCMVKDVAVEVPVPENTIPDLIIPSHIVVPRCTGLCLTSIGSSCSPRKTKIENHNIVVYVNSTPYCSTIQLEHHRGPCRCECDKTEQTCIALGPRHVYSEESCSCICNPNLIHNKIECENRTSYHWNTDSCECLCKNQRICPPGSSWDEGVCSCLQNSVGEEECLLKHENLSAEVGRFNLYPVYLTSIVIVLIILIVASLCFIFSHR